MASSLSKPTAKLLLTNASRSVNTAAAKWREAQMAFINARVAYDLKHFENRVQENELRARYKALQEAARAAMNDYYTAVDLANKASTLAS